MTTVIRFQYADDCAILVHTAEELQTSLDLLTEVYQSLRLSTNIRKTKIIYQSAPGNVEGPPDIKISGTTLAEGRNSTPYMLCQHTLQETAQSSLR